MDNKSMYALQYGVFMIGSAADGKKNGCITNTCIQVASNPTRVACAIIKTNYTCELVERGGFFTVSVLDKNASFETIKHFGFQSGRDVDKLADLQLPEDANGVPYLGWSTCAVLSCKVVDVTDLGSHKLFIAEVVDGKVTGEGEPLTYAYYQSDVKPKPAPKTEDKKIKAWKCKICGYVYEGSTLLDDFLCPLCGHDKSDFEPIYE